MDYHDKPHKDYDPDYDPEIFEQQLHQFEEGIDPIETEEARRDRQEFQARLTTTFSDIYRRANHYGLNWGNIVVIETEDQTGLANLLEQLNVIADSNEDDNPTLNMNDQQIARYILLITFERLRQIYPQYRTGDYQEVDIKSLQLDILADIHLNYLSQAKILTIVAGLSLDGEGIDIRLLRDKRSLEQAIIKHEWETAINDEIARQYEASRSEIFDSINVFLADHHLAMHDDLDTKVLGHIEAAIDQYFKGSREKSDQHFASARTGAAEIGVDITDLISFVDFLLDRSSDESD